MFFGVVFVLYVHCLVGTLILLFVAHYHCLSSLKTDTERFLENESKGGSYSFRVRWETGEGGGRGYVQGRI